MCSRDTQLETPRARNALWERIPGVARWAGSPEYPAFEPLGFVWWLPFSFSRGRRVSGVSVGSALYSVPLKLHVSLRTGQVGTPASGAPAEMKEDASAEDGSPKSGMGVEKGGEKGVELGGEKESPVGAKESQSADASQSVWKALQASVVENAQVCLYWKAMVY